MLGTQEKRKNAAKNLVLDGLLIGTQKSPISSPILTKSADQ